VKIAKKHVRNSIITESFTAAIVLKSRVKMGGGIYRHFSTFRWLCAAVFTAAIAPCYSNISIITPPGPPTPATKILAAAYAIRYQVTRYLQKQA